MWTTVPAPLNCARRMGIVIDLRVAVRCGCDVCALVNMHGICALVNRHGTLLRSACLRATSPSQPLSQATYSAALGSSSTSTSSTRRSSAASRATRRPPQRPSRRAAATAAAAARWTATASASPALRQPCSARCGRSSTSSQTSSTAARSDGARPLPRREPVRCRRVLHGPMTSTASWQRRLRCTAGPHLRQPPILAHRIAVVRCSCCAEAARRSVWLCGAVAVHASALHACASLPEALLCPEVGRMAAM